MRTPSGVRLVLLLTLLLPALLTACQSEPSVVPADTLENSPAPSGTLPPPSLTRTARPGPRITSTPQPEGGVILPISTLAVKPSELKGLKVAFWHTAAGEASVYLQVLVGEFNQSNSWDITVEAVPFPSPGVLDEAFRQAVVEKQLPGLVAAYTAQALRWDANGNTLADLSPYLNDPTYGLSAAEQQDFFPQLWSQDIMLRRSGSGPATPKRVGMPWYRIGLVMIYNQTWAEELGFRSLPESPGEFRQQVCAASQANRKDQDRTNDGTGGWLATSEPLVLLGWLHAFGAEVVRENGSGYTFNTTQSERAVHFLGELAAAGCAWSAGERPAPEEFAARRTLAWIGSLSSLAAQQQALKAAGSEDEWVVLPFPSSDTNPLIEVYGPDLLVIESTPAQELAAWLFARWLLSPDQQAGWAEINGVFPVGEAAVEQLQSSANGSQQWSQALEWLPYARVEPSFASWGVMRWVLGDALAQIMAPGFNPDKAPDVVKVLDQLAAEVQTQVR